MHTRELAGRLGAIGWKVVLCFHKGPSPEVREYLSLPNVRWEQLPNCWENSWQVSRDLFRILARHRPSLVHFQFTPFLSFNAWIARLNGARSVVVLSLIHISAATFTDTWIAWPVAGFSPVA